MAYLERATLKPRGFGSTAAVITRGVYELGPKEVVHRIGKSKSSVARYTDPDEPPRMTYDIARTLTAAGAKAFVEDLCFLANGAFMPAAAPPNATVNSLTAQVQRNMGELSALLLESSDPNHALTVLPQLKAVTDSIRLLAAAHALLVEKAEGRA